MPDSVRGIASSEDIQSLADAARLLDVSETASDSEVEDAVTDMALDYHPDQGGTAALFTAIQDAGDVVKGNIGVPPSAPESQRRTPRRSPGASSSTTGSSGSGGRSRTEDDIGARSPSGSRTGFTDSEEGTSEEEVEQIRQAVREVIDRRFGVGEIQQRYGVSVSRQEFVEILTTLILSGSVTLGSVEKMAGTDESVGGTGDSRFGGGDDRFEHKDARYGSGDERFGDGDSNFG